MENILRVNTTVDENDGSATQGTGLSLRDAIIIANSTPEDEIIELESGQVYDLAIAGIDPSDFVLDSGFANASETTLRGDLDILPRSGKLTIRGLGEGAVINGNQIHRVFEVRDDPNENGATLVLENIAIGGGRAISEQDSSIFLNNDGGGAILINHYATVELNVCVIGGNQAPNGGTGGAILNNGTLTIQNCNIDTNVANNVGGAIYTNNGVTSIIDSTIANNNSENDGGGVAHGGAGSTEIINTTINDNTANSQGGGIYIGNNIIGDLGLPSVTIIDSVISGNTANTGGGISSDGVRGFAIENTTIENNNATSSGGGIDISGIFDDLTLRNSIVRNNTANNNGGGINLST
ncbi:MAG: hypothetical protein QNJ32_25540 [Xenococcaceae cyanobacterium MO_167.B27]|nr:hypothetical protein [Xenococcaceae cyanobacterium MO_167.B27]